MKTNPPFTTTLFIRKEALKFSSAHMTVFPDGTKEALHGHNYATELVVELEATSLQNMVSFSFFKAALKKVCTQWDEKVLLPRLCPQLKAVASSPKETEFHLCGKRYVLPSDEVEWIEADNITSETLAATALSAVLREIQSSPEFAVVRSIALKVIESPEQGASALWRKTP
jgi:6-pyruvoyltetrahydropterin/6-carboxytetrahydropterin synthase